MIVYYDPTDNNQVQAIYSDTTTSTVWGGFTEVEVTDAALVADLMKYGRDCRVTIVADEVTAVTQFDHPVDHSLANLKIDRYDEIDKKTVELIDAGFVHDSKTFSLSRAAQSKWHGKYNARADVTFPFKVTTISHEAYSVVDGPEAKTMYCATFFTLTSWLAEDATR